MGGSCGNTLLYQLFWRVYTTTIDGIREDIKASRKDVELTKQEIHLSKIEMREHAKKYEADTARRDARWETLLQKIYNIEKKSYMLEQEYRSRKKKRYRRELSTESI